MLLEAVRWPYATLLLGSARHCGLRLFKGPSVVRRVSALLVWGKAHIGEDAGQVRWLNVPGHEPVHNRQMACVACRILFEDPLAGFGAEREHAAVARDLFGRCTDRRAAHRDLADVANNEKRFEMGAANLPLAHIFGDGLPIRAKSVLPTGVLRFQPFTLRIVHACSRIPPDGPPFQPDPQVEGVMEPVQLLQERVPVPRTLQAEITELIAELLDDPFKHELPKGHAAMNKGGVVI